MFHFHWKESSNENALSFQVVYRGWSIHIVQCFVVYVPLLRGTFRTVFRDWKSNIMHDGDIT